jgi:hypothetical protein
MRSAAAAPTERRTIRDSRGRWTPRKEDTHERLRRARQLDGVIELGELHRCPLPRTLAGRQLVERYATARGQLRAAQLVILAVAAAAAERGALFAASLDAIAHFAGTSKKTAERARAQLAARGLIRLLPRFRRLLGPVDVARYRRAAPQLRRLELSPVLQLDAADAAPLQARPRVDPLAAIKRASWRARARAGEAIWTWRELRDRKLTIQGDTPIPDRSVPDRVLRARVRGRRIRREGAATPRSRVLPAAASTGARRLDGARELASPAPRGEGIACRSPSPVKHAASVHTLPPERVSSPPWTETPAAVALDDAAWDQLVAAIEQRIERGGEG